MIYGTPYFLSFLQASNTKPRSINLCTSITSFPVEQADRFIRSNRPFYNLNQFNGLPVHFGHGERPRLTKPNLIEDAKVRESLLKKLINDHGEWQRVLDSESFPEGDNILKKVKPDRIIHIGRGPNNDLRIGNRYLSRQHGNLALVKGKYFYTDEHSAPGTYLIIQIPGPKSELSLKPYGAKVYTSVKESNMGRKILGNSALVFPHLKNPFLVLLSNTNGIEFKPLEQHEIILNGSNPKESNLLFSRMVQNLKNHETLYVTGTETDQSIKVIAQSISNTPPKNILYRLSKCLADDSFIIQSYHPNCQKVIQFVSPFIKSPAEMPVLPGDQICLPKSSDKSLHVTVPSYPSVESTLITPSHEYIATPRSLLFNSFDWSDPYWRKNSNLGR